MMENRLTFDIEADELEIFLEEVDEHLEAVEAGTLRLEQGADPDTLNSIFRAAHSLKALAATVGHHPMAELTHTMETLFDAMREARISPTQAMIDQLLTAVDVLRAQRTEIVHREPSGVNVAAVLAGLHALNAEGSGAGAAQTGFDLPHPPRRLTPAQSTQVKDYHEAGQVILEIEAVTGTDTFAPAARLLQATMALMEVGQIIVQHPSMTDLTNNQHSGRLWLILASEAEVGAIEELLAGVSDLEEIQVRHYQFEKAPAPAAVSVPAAGPSAPDSTGDKTVRISVERLDNLMNLVGELVADRNRLLQIEEMLHVQYGKAENVSTLGEVTAHFGQVVDQLQEEVMRARMLPIAHLFNKFPRMVRDVARAAGKQVNLVIEGEATELDRSLIEVIGDPLIHLLRNAVDHGLESPEARTAAHKPAAGSVRLTAAHVEGQIVITVQDDGRGIDPARVRHAAVSRGLLSEEEANQLDDEESIDLIFQPGLSTAEQVSEVSGRGVGMDVVRTNVERLSGSVAVESVLGCGTTFRVTLPLTLAIVDTMLVVLGESVYAIPLACIMDSSYLSDVRISTVQGNPVIRWRDSVLPLVYLRDFLAHSRLANAPPNGAKPVVVTVARGKQQVGLVVDEIIGKQEIVVKSLSPIIGEVPGLSGATILGDGRIALILDVVGLVHAFQFSHGHGSDTKKRG
jgi:two-component system chemotaxis sensor kinase CheA